MADSLKQHLLRETLTNGVTNALFNGGIAWWLVKDRDDIAVWGAAGLGVDFAATGFILVFIVTLIMIPLQKRQFASGKIPAEPVTYPLRSLIRRDIRSVSLLGLWLGICAVVLFVPPVLLGLWLLGISSLTPLAFALFKGVWAGCVAALMISPMIDFSCGLHKLAVQREGGSF